MSRRILKPASRLRRSLASLVYTSLLPAPWRLCSRAMDMNLDYGLTDGQSFGYNIVFVLPVVYECSHIRHIRHRMGGRGK